MGGGGWDRDTDREGWGSELTLVQGSNKRGVKKKSIQQWKSMWAHMTACFRDTLGKLYIFKSVLLDFDTRPLIRSYF